ncbi:hypothetical protein LWC35_33865 [Pseudonocardia kujensis]|uniref:hypothetical protein n=1 Tax=Pseudonocardia kujensis TaxID=1128675 RepID=UPI001E4B5FFB|nr:hypothetical protein [Pseudonocardia kujensis]MCE0767850.1 hypothetical protein [Pseudonocardia kujensis]
MSSGNSGGCCTAQKIHSVLRAGDRQRGGQRADPHAEHPEQDQPHDHVQRANGIATSVMIERLAGQAGT